MYHKNLEDLLVVEVSDWSDVDPSDAALQTAQPNELDELNYNDVISQILQGNDSESVSDSFVESIPTSPILAAKSSTSDYRKKDLTGYNYAEASESSVRGLSGMSSCGDAESDYNRNPEVVNNAYPCLEQAKEPCTIASRAIDSGNHGEAGVIYPLWENESLLRDKCDIFLNQLLVTSGPSLQILSPLVKEQLLAVKNIPKVNYLRRKAAEKSSEASDTCSLATHSSIPQRFNDAQNLDYFNACLEKLGIPQTCLEADGKSGLWIHQRHNASDALERLGLFNDTIIRTDSKALSKAEVKLPNDIIFTCIATNNNLLVAGTSSGALLIGDIYNRNYERQFAPNQESEKNKDKSNEQHLAWQEVDNNSESGVTCIDVLSGSNWIVVGYGNGVLKLLHLNKGTPHGKHSELFSKDPASSKPNSDYGNNSRGFGMMADAVSSAFAGFKKSGSHALCSSKVFGTSVALCKFTITDSHEEIICTNKKAVALLTYNKTVLSHSLTVNNLQSFNAVAVENDEIVDIACLSSNPQSRYIRGMKVGGIVAITTTTKCFVICTLPEVSIMFKVPFNDYPRKSPSGASILPRITWMVLNKNGEIRPLLLILLANRLSFTLCDVSTEKHYGGSVLCTNIGYIRFDNVVRKICIVSRDLLAAIDFENNLKLIQVSLFGSLMHYDVVRSLNLSAEGVSDELWAGMTNITSTVAVQTRTVKMVANSYKKFSILVSELFGGKKSDNFFELRVACLYILKKEGIWSSEIYSWIKIIGEHTVTKKFPEALAICQALHQGLVPGLVDYKAYIDNIKKLILYVLHQSAAHIIRLSKLMDTASINVLEDNDDGWTDDMKVDIIYQIDNLCCSMFDVCIIMKMYESLNDLIYRCFETLKIEHIFVKYVMLNYFKGGMNLAHLNPEIFETIWDIYDNTLDYISKEYFASTEGIEDCIVFINDQAEFNRRDGGNISIPYYGTNIDEHILVYEMLCNHIAALYAFCSRNEIPINKEKGVCRLSKYSLWHCFMYCPDFIGNDISLALDVLSSEASNIISSRYVSTAPSTGVGGNLHGSVEDIFVVRVLYSVLNSCLTFQSCPVYSGSSVSSFCKVIAYLTSKGPLNSSSLMLSSDIRYARSELEYENEIIDFDNMDRLSFKTVFSEADGPCPLQRLMSISPRLLFTCLANLFLEGSSTFEEHSTTIGSKIDVFNVVVNALVGCLNMLEELQATFTIRQMLSIFVLGVSVFSDSFYLDLRLQAVAIYTLMTEVGSMDHGNFVDPGPLSSKEIMLDDGSFNSNYYFNKFCKKSEEIFENIRQFNISNDLTNSLLKLHIRKCLLGIYQKFDCQTNWTRNSHFSNFRKFCSGLIELAVDFEMRLFLCEAIGDYDKVISVCESICPEKLFNYLETCVNCLKVDTPTSDCTINQLLLKDPSLQKEFLRVLMNNIPRLIGVDLKGSTELLVDLFSLSTITNVLHDSDLKNSQDVVISALKDFPELQLTVLSALLEMHTEDVSNDTYFQQYLSLLAEHDKGSISTILKRQKKLNISSCLEICMSANVQDAVAYLLMRAGDFEGASKWILKAFKSHSNDLDMCERLIDDAQYMCTTFEEYISDDTLEAMWFGILNCLILEVNTPGVTGLIEEVFSVGILKFIKLTRVLRELENYGSAEVSTFKSSLEKLLCHLDCQTYMINKASSMSNEVLNMEFRRGIEYSKQGVVIEVPEGPEDKLLRCLLCKEDMIMEPDFESDDGRDLPQANRNTRRMSQQQENRESSDISPFEQNMGMIYTVTSGVGKAEEVGAQGRVSTHHLSSIYNDRLSTFLRRKQQSNTTRAAWSLSTLGIAPQFLPAVKSQIYGSRSFQPLSIFWCGHVFHATCAPVRCPLCCTD